MGLAIQRDHAPDDGTIAAEPALPDTMAEDSDPLAEGRGIAREGRPEHGLSGQDAKEGLGHGLDGDQEGIVGSFQPALGLALESRQSLEGLRLPLPLEEVPDGDLSDPGAALDVDRPQARDAVGPVDLREVEDDGEESAVGRGDTPDRHSERQDRRCRGARLPPGKSPR
ncbi:MAG TPA: hypothetical protein VLL75_03125 [Vicinamibacteria bacterium]|nr:hypothetical protein [Vicinamibacteria bacterium]